MGWRGTEVGAALDTVADDARLRLLAISELAEPGVATEPTFPPLARQIAAADPVWLDGVVRSLAQVPGLSAPAAVAALEAAATWSGVGRPGGRQLVAAALRTPPDAGFALDYWRARHGAALPKPVKRGIADAVTRLFDVETIARQSTGRGRARLADLLRAVHPVPRTVAQAEAFRAVLARRPSPGPPGPLQIISGYPGRRPTAADWAAALPSMSVPEILRHLPDFDRAGLDDGPVAEALARLSAPPAGLSPLLVYRRYRRARTRRWDTALASALAAAIAGLPRWPGRTLLLVDLRYSWMRRPRRRPSGDLPRQPRTGATPGMLAVALGGALQLAGSDVDVVSSEGHTFAAQDPAHLLASVEAFAHHQFRKPPLAWGRRRYSTYDRVVLVKLVNRWNTRDDPQVPAGVPLYRFGYRNEAGGPQFHVSGRHVEFWGLTDHAAWLVPLWEEALRPRSTAAP
jgi:hypothetical protein